MALCFSGLYLFLLSEEYLSPELVLYYCNVKYEIMDDGNLRVFFFFFW